jgi:hypothetical protein
MTEGGLLFRGPLCIMIYGIFFSRNSSNIYCVCMLENRIITIISGAGTNSSCRNLFKKLDILPVSYQYVLSLIMFVVYFIRKIFSLTYLYLD